MTFIIDMNLPVEWREMLTFDDCNALHWSEIGKANDADDSIMEYARVHSYVIVTQDLDFGEILKSTEARSPSVVQIRNENIDPVFCKDTVIELLRLVKTDLASGALVTMSPHKHRLRSLPFFSSKEKNTEEFPITDH